MSKKYLRDLVPLIVICLISALLLASFNLFTKGPIAENTLRTAQETRSRLLAAATDFESMELPEGSGMDVTTSNITWCTGEMYISALATAGITDARIIVASPFEVSGTAALTGVYKAYEDMTGKKLDDLAKLVSTQELTITGELANEIGGMDSTSIVNDLKLMLDETQKMTDDEIRAEIIDIAGRYNVSLTNTQIQQLIDLCRSLEGLDADSLKARVEEVQGTLQKVSDAKTKVVGFVETVKKVVTSVSSFFDRIKDIIAKF